MLFKRYASPFLLLDQIISEGKMCEFLDKLAEIKQEEEEWEFYIHKVPSWDERSFEEFKNDLRKNNNVVEFEKPSDEQLKTTVQNSYKVLKDFKI